MLMCEFAREKCYYLKIIELFREISNWLKKRIELENFKLLFKSKTFLENKYQHEKLYKVSDNIWLEILQNQKGICFLQNSRTSDAFSDIHSCTLKNCGHCTMENCFPLAKDVIMFLKNYVKKKYININFQITCWEFI